jgi:hypothetical protein
VHRQTFLSDGTIVFDRGYLADPAGLEFLPGAAAGLRRPHEAPIGIGPG